MREAAVLPRRPDAARPLWRDRPGVGRPPDAALLAACAGNLALASVLAARGLDGPAATALLRAEEQPQADPFLFGAMRRAVDRLRAAARAAEPCAVFGDFDCDGLTGTALLTEGLTSLGLPVTALLPSRRRDGYGLSPHHVETLAAGGLRLLVTVDCGSSSHPALRRAVELGMDVIVTDHHPPHGPPPPALALLNPRAVGEGYPDHDLCGAGVAHALLRALAADGADLDPDAGLDLLVLGTVADVVPLRGENRGLVRRGLPRLAATRRPGLRVLLEVSGVSRLTLGPRDIGFGLGPRLNAAGRLGDAHLALDLLRAPRLRDARPLAAELDAINTRRQEITRQAADEATAAIEATGGPGAMIVAWDAGWHPGVVGLVASRLVERYRRPAVVVGSTDGRWRGSARSVEGFDVGAALNSCADLLLRQGGHPMAAGLEATDEIALAALRPRLEAEARRVLGDAERPPVLAIDLHLPADGLDWALADAMAALSPCGASWPDALVAVHHAEVLEVGRSGGAVRLIVAGRGGMAVSAVARGETLPGPIVAGDVLDLAATPTVRDRRGYRCLELDIHDARRAGPASAEPADPARMMV